MKQVNFDGGYIESEREKHPLYKKISDEGHNIGNELKNDEMKLYFVLDRFIYRNEKGKIEFDSGFYQKTHNLNFSNDPDEFFLQYSLRLMSLHTLIMRECLPFVAIGIWKHNREIYPFVEKIPERLEYKLFDLREKWNWLANDIEILEKNISLKSIFEKALIWYTLAELSQTNLETFMNLYRCLETLSTEFYSNKEYMSNKFINDELYILNEQNKKNMSLGVKSKLYLKSQCIECKKIKKIIDFRNKIAHGGDYALELNLDLIHTIDEMEKIIPVILNRKIKKMGLINLKNPSFLIKYKILIWESERKIVLTDGDDSNCYRYPRNYDIGINFGRQESEDKLIEMIQDDLRNSGIEKDKQFYKMLVESFGQIANY